MSGVTISTDPLTALRAGHIPHPADARARYRATGVVPVEPVWSLLDHAADRSPGALAVSDDHRSWTYDELRHAVAARAAGFLDNGLIPGERVIVQYRNSGAFAISALGLLRAGLVPVMTLPAHRITEIAHLAETAGAAAYVGDHAAMAEQLPARVSTVRAAYVDGSEHRPPPDRDPTSAVLPTSVDPDLPAVLLVSGGTTGLPKLISRTHSDYAYNARRAAEVTRLGPDDVYLAALPGAHNFPLCCPGLLGALTVGAHTVYTDNPSPDNAFAVVERHGVTVTALVPALAQVWCAATEWEPADTSSLRLLQVGGAKLSRPDAVALDAAFGPVVQQVFGMAEGLICMTGLDDPRDLVHEAQGAPMSDLDEVRIVDEEGRDVRDCEPGELLTRGPYTIRGYFAAPEHTARSVTDDGWYRSGDQVRRLPSGHLVVTGRLKDTIVRAGENVAADDIEEHLLAHPDITAAAVVGVADDALGERICAVVVGSGDGLDLPSLRRYLADRGLASFKLPDAVRRMSSLPLTAVGKIDKAALRRDLAER